MRLDNRWESTDREASRWALAALELKGAVADIMEVCAASNTPYPYTDDDLRYIAVKCRAWGIRTSVDGEAFWEALR